MEDDTSHKYWLRIGYYATSIFNSHCNNSSAST